MASNASFSIRAIERTDIDPWKPLWASYNAFYGREGDTPLLQEIINITWQRFFDDAEHHTCPGDPSRR